MKPDGKFLALLTAGLLVFAAPSEAQELLTTLTPSDGELQDFFGASTAISDDHILVSAPAENEAGSQAGAVYAFRRVGTHWVPEGKLVPPGLGTDDFLFSVAVDGDLALLGTSEDDDLGTGAGAVYAYAWDGSDWQFVEKLFAGDASAHSGFGNSVARSGDLALVGAPYHLHGGGSGAAYVFRWNGSSWDQEAELRPADIALNDAFGLSVSLWDDVALIGADNDDDNGASSGSAYVFRWDGNTWQEEDKLTADNGLPFDRFGYSVAVHDDVALVGAPNTIFDTGLARAYVFRHDSSTWQQEDELVGGDVIPYENFAETVAVGRNVALVGASGHDHSGVGTGAAYLFRFDSGQWVESDEILPPKPGQPAAVGYGLSVRDEVGVVGNVFDPVLSTAGAAHVLALNWEDLGFALAGTHGDPRMLGVGPLSPLSRLSLSVESTLASTSTFLVVALARIDLPFAGGTIVPALDPPLGFILVVPTDAGGEWLIDTVWPTGVPAGIDLFFQTWLEDASGVAGYASSNALRGRTTD